VVALLDVKVALDGIEHAKREEWMGGRWATEDDMV
jgi:hypothetical protein